MKKQTETQRRAFRHNQLVGNVLCAKRNVEGVMNSPTSTAHEQGVAARIANELDWLAERLRKYRVEPDGSIKELKR